MNLEAIIIIFAASMVELWMGIPLGLVLDVNPILIAITAALGAILSAFIVITIGDNLRNRLIKWKYKDEQELEKSRLYEIWNKYGVIGLGLLSPLLFGAPLGAAVGVALGAGKERLLIWMSIGILVWSIGLTLAGLMGFLALENAV
ncbi:MAG TPA: small multi-drug export protein [Methanobacterium sp.]|jgi:membrane protein YqaA with SNARE-associated domain|nr:small multi-drug export protein [Methanobacterium sp.]HOI40756.1 small multi-drug export protein [Methanobacterium sp.]